MDPTFRNRFLGIPSSSSSALTSAANGYELNEDDVLWTNNDFADPSSADATAAANNNSHRQTNHNLNRRSSFPKNSGILAALPESDNHPVLYRKPSLGAASSSKVIPRPPPPLGEYEYTASKNQSAPAAMRKMNHSAPMNVPVLSAATAKEGQRKYWENDGYDDNDEEDEEMLPPHEIVARGSRKSPKTTFSVLEGVGRTLKGRDLRQVRNAVWRQTGFLD